MNNNETYQQIFINIFRVKPEDLDETFTFKDQPRWDSLAHLQLISELEETFGILFDSEDILNYGSYLNGFNILKRYGVELSQ